MTLPRVIVCQPCYKMIDPEVAYGQTMGMCHRSNDVILDFRYKKNMYIDMARNDLTLSVLNHPGLATHALWLDDDMYWPRDMIYKLLLHDLPVVGALYFKKADPYDTTCGMILDGPTHQRPEAKFLLQPLDHLPTGLEQVDCLGFGATLVKTEVFRAMAERYGDEEWFRSERSGEDVHFAWRCKQMGIPQYVDGSIDCGHIMQALCNRQSWIMGHTKKNGEKIPMRVAQ